MAQPMPATAETVAVPEAAGHEAAFPPFNAATFASQILWLAIAFGVLYYLMAKVALPRIGGILESRAKRLADDLAEAQRMKAESEAAAEAYRASLAEAHAKAQAIAQERRNGVNAEAEGRRRVLEAELADKLAASEAAIRAQTEQAMGNVRGIAADTAVAIVEHLTGRAPDRATVETALDSTGTR